MIYKFSTFLSINTSIHPPTPLVITYPYIVVKSRMQLKQSADNSKRYTGVTDAFQKIIKDEGVSGLYKGIQSKASQSVLTAAILFLAKERIFNYTVKLLVIFGLKQK